MTTFANGYRAGLEAALKIIQSNTTPCSTAYPGYWTEKGIMNYDAGQADAAHSFCNAIRTLPVPEGLDDICPRCAHAGGLDDTDDIGLAADEIDRLRAENERLRAALSLYSCEDGCNECPPENRDEVGCGWTAYIALKGGV